MILNIYYNDFQHMGMSQMCTGAGDYFRPSKPHSGKLCTVILYQSGSYFSDHRAAPTEAAHCLNALDYQFLLYFSFRVAGIFETIALFQLRLPAVLGHWTTNCH